MTAVFARCKSRFARWREWELNPIVIKELRQAVRSWAVTGMLLLFLTILFITSLAFVISQSFEVNVNLGLGGAMFSAFVVILAVASVLFIPLYIGVRVAVERPENNPDLLYISTLSPTRIVFGKFLCGAYIAALFFSACMPFMAFTNLLRGVDLPTVFFILSFLFLVICAINMIAIFLACLPLSRLFKLLFVVYAFFQSIGIVGSLVGTSFLMMRSGVGAMMAERNFWIGTLTALGVGIAVTGLFFVLSTALISPPSANRALPTRLYLTAIWILGGWLSLGWVWHTGNNRMIFLWTDPTFILMALALLVTVSNSDQLSRRVRRRIPRSWIKRAFAFIFFNGAAGGLLWAGMILTITYLVTRMVLASHPKMITISQSGHWFATATAYVFDYALTALLIHRTFLRQRPPKVAGVIAILIPSLIALVPSILLFFLNQLSWKAVEHLQLGNIFNLFVVRNADQALYHRYFAFGWLALIMILNAKWFWRQVKSFGPLDEMEAPPVLAEMPPVIPK